MPEDSHDGIVAYATTPDADVALVLVHSGGQKGSGLLNRLRKLPSVHEHKSEQVKPADLVGFVMEEGRKVGGQVDRDAADALVEAIGGDLRALAAAVEQLSHDFPGQPLSTEIVGRYFSGRADVKGYIIAEHALSGRTAQALEELRWALETGVGGPAITGSFASAVRSLARLKGAARGACATPTWPARSGCRRSGSATCATSCAAGTSRDSGWPSAPWPRPTPRSRAPGRTPAYSLERMVLTLAGARVGGR